MKELLENLETIEIKESNGYTLIDTCAFIHIFEHHDKISKFKKSISKGKFGLTSFNVEELIHIEHRLHDNIKTEIRHFLKNEKKNYDGLKIINIDVHPGNINSEKEFIASVDMELLKIMSQDYSDGVLFATAVKIGGDIITRDKHHIYNQIAETYANNHNIDIRNKI